MEEIDLIYMEENFDEVMSQVELGRSFLLRTPDGAGIVIHSTKNPVIEKMKNEGLIEKFE